MAAKKSAKQASKESQGFTPEERAAMKERAKELKAAARTSADKAEGEKAVLAKIAQMPEPDRAMGKKLHAIIMASAPNLVPRLWYGMPAYSKNGEIVCFYQNAGKFKVRYGTLGFSDEAKLDEGRMWPSAYALTEITPAEETRIAALIKKAVA